MKRLLPLALCVLIFISSMVPAFGQTVQLSPWAIQDVFEGEIYGIFSPNWLLDGFNLPIAKERFEVLLLNVSDKLESAGIKGNPEFEPILLSETLNRGEVVKGFYNLLAYYDLTDESDPVEALTALNVIKGDGKSLALDVPCTVEQAVVMASRLVYGVFDANALGAKGLIWEVENGDNKVYLLGSIHLGITGLYPLDTRILKALNHSDVLWVEANVFDPSATSEVYEVAMLPEGETLESKLEPELYEKLALALGNMGIPIEALSAFKPWFVEKLISVQVMKDTINKGGDMTDINAIANMTHGLDAYFLINSMLMGKPIEELEGVKHQALMLNALSDEVYERQLEALVDALLLEENEGLEQTNELSKVLDNLFEYWCDGDIDGFKNAFVVVLDQEQDSEYTQMLTGERDVKMAARIHELLISEEAGTHFVVVGAAHLIGDLSIIANLEAMGYEVKIY